MKTRCTLRFFDFESNIIKEIISDVDVPKGTKRQDFLKLKDVDMLIRWLPDDEYDRVKRISVSCTMPVTFSFYKHGIRNDDEAFMPLHDR